MIEDKTISAAERQRQFVPLFIFVLGVDFLVAVVKSTGDEIWSHLAMMWTGPLDDIFYFLVAMQAVLFLLDPSGTKTQGPDGNHSWKMVWRLLTDGERLDRVFAHSFMNGARAALQALPVLVGMTLVLSVVVDSVFIMGAKFALYRHLSLVFPIYLLIGAGLSFLRLVPDAMGFWRATLLGWLGLFAVAASDGRWDNHLFHLFSNLESVQAWCAAFAWSAFMVAPKSSDAHPVRAEA